jgi:hypothetical protein
VPSTTPPSIGTTVSARPSEAAIDSKVARLAFRMIARRGRHGLRVAGMLNAGLAAPAPAISDDSGGCAC